MRMNPIGKTTIQVSEYGLGTWAMGGGIYGMADDAESIRTIHRAGELGVNFLDTAPMYGIGDLADGRAERVVGEAVAGQRERWVIATKYGRHLNGNAEWWNMREDYSGAQAIRSVEESLQRMRTDYIDMLFVHSPPSALFNAEDAFAAMTQLKQQGKIRAVGFSFWENVADTLPQVEQFLRSGVIDAVQAKVSLLVHEALSTLFPVVRESGTAVVARESLAQGFLTDSFGPDGPFVEQDFKASMPREEVARRLDRANQFRFLARQLPAINSLPEAALHWALSHPEVTSVIPGAKSVQELEQCLAAQSSDHFPDEIMQRARGMQLAWPD
ncbi:MAG: aldo/keto reductase [Candidatus Sumerlaeaceae bacterium]